MTIPSSQSRKAVVLMSGGLDSTTVLASAIAEGFECYPITFQYGQRHNIELDAAKKIAEFYQLKDFKVVPIDLTLWGGSSLTDTSMDVPEGGTTEGIPSTYVPARNLIFLSFAAAYAEVLGTTHIFIGVNSVDYSGYPDCRPRFISAFAETAKLATTTADTNETWQIHAPLQNLSKSQIIKMASDLGAPLFLTHSCYNPTGEKACGVCDSCKLRKEGFIEANVEDPTQYV